MEGIVMLFVYIAIIGVIAYAITTFVPMPQPFKTLIYILGGLFCLVLLLKQLPGLLPA